MKFFNMVIPLSALPENSIISFDSELLKMALMVLVNVGILIVILALVLYKPVRAYMDNRTERIKGELGEAKATLDEAEDLKEEYLNRLKDIDLEREEILSAAHKKAMERSDHILLQARDEAENIYSHTMAELEEERDSIQNELKRQLVELSVMVAGRFVSETIDPSTHDRFIDEALADWEEGLWLD